MFGFKQKYINKNETFNQFLNSIIRTEKSQLFAIWNGKFSSFFFCFHLFYLDDFCWTMISKRFCRPLLENLQNIFPECPIIVILCQTRLNLLFILHALFFTLSWNISKILHLRIKTDADCHFWIKNCFKRKILALKRNILQKKWGKKNKLEKNKTQ